MTALLLLACVHRQPEPLFPPIHRVDLPAPHVPEPRPTDCPDVDVEPGPLAWAPGGVASCYGQLVSPTLALELAQARDLGPVAVEGLRACEDHADALRAVYEQRLADERALRLYAEREARVGRLGLVVGVVLGGAAAVGVLAAAEGVTR